jgi:hypothetical protein
MANGKKVAKGNSKIKIAIEDAHYETTYRG